MLCLVFLLYAFKLVQAATLETYGAYPCSSDQSDISVSNFTFNFDKSTNDVTYTVHAYSTANVSILGKLLICPSKNFFSSNLYIAQIEIFAYGKSVLKELVNLCSVNVEELCPVKEGHSITSGTHEVPSKYTDSISQAAYLVPDLEGSITIDIFNASNPSQNLGCFHSSITNGKSTQTEGVKYATLGLAAAALIISGLSSAANGGSSGPAPASSTAPPAVSATSHGMPVAPTGAEAHAATGATTAPAASGPGTNVAAGGWHPPGFSEFFSILQGIAVSGMYSLNYPTTYRSFSQNVGWSVGVITWEGLQLSIDNFRNMTGGNLTASSYQVLQQTTLVYRDSSNANTSEITIQSVPSSTSTNSSLTKRFLMIRQEATTNSTSEDSEKKYVSIVSGIKAYVEKLTVPSTNTFMTLLIWWAIIVGICIIVILSVKVTLEIWSIRGNPKKRFEGFRKRYHIFLSTTLVRLVLIFYGIWVLYCFYQFKIGDAWGTRLLAGLLFALLTIVLLGFTVRIIYLAHTASKYHGGLEYLFAHKPWIRMYGLFYDQFKIKYWWMFIPTLLASFGRNAFVALGYGNGLVQVIGQIVIDVILTMFYVCLRPFNTKMGNGINIAIQVVRLISLALLLTFAVQFQLNQIVATGIGMALIVVQAILTILLAVLIGVNACFGLFKMTCGNRRNKKKKEKEAEKKEATENNELANSTSNSFNSEKNEIYASVRSVGTSSIEGSTSSAHIRTSTNDSTNSSNNYPPVPSFPQERPSQSSKDNISLSEFDFSEHPMKKKNDSLA